MARYVQDQNLCPWLRANCCDLSRSDFGCRGLCMCKSTATYPGCPKYNSLCVIGNLYSR